MTPGIGAMLIERYQLYEKILALGKVIDLSPEFHSLPPEERVDMENQLAAMQDYRNALESRIRRADPGGHRDPS